LDGFSDKVGTVMGGSWKGISYTHSLPQHVKNPRMEGQVSQRPKFAITLNFLKPVTGLLRTGWKLYAHRQSSFNAAMSYTLANAITGTYPDYAIDPGKVSVSHSSLAPAAGGTVTFAWKDNPGVGNAKQTDRALITVINPGKSEAVYSTAGAEGITVTQDITIPADWVGENVEAYIGFILKDGKEVANSVYLGTLTVA
jgi:hypothetical protein